MSETEFLEIIRAICKRPTMYTATGTFFEAVSFLEGFSSGKDVGDTAYHSSFTPFLKWLGGRTKGDSQFPLSWIEVRNQFSSDAQACEKLPKLYQSFLDEATNKA